MAQKPGFRIFEIGETRIRAGWNGRAASVAFARDDDVLVIDLDSAATWENGEDIEMNELTRLLELIESECAARGIEAEFE